jgi:hypothetical protein
MEEVRKIYDKTRLELKGLLNGLKSEMENLQFVLDNDIVSSNGNILSSEEMEEIQDELNVRKREIEYEISFVKAQIAYIDSI